MAIAVVVGEQFGLDIHHQKTLQQLKLTHQWFDQWLIYH
jgi:hypothetical protein